jgi:hypothetical protein
MTMTEAAEQAQIFDGPLEDAELGIVNNLINKNRANAALTQQLALDASRLVATSKKRLLKQSEAGFFKRLAGSFNGKTSQDHQLNQQDMLQMQKYAWHYLQQLQQQNLINSQAIGVIRNNLGAMNDVIIETRDFLEQIVDRLHHVEKNINFSNWALNVEANKRRIKLTPKIVLILRLTYDFMLKHPEADVSEVEVHVVTTLEKLEVDCDADIRLLDFISELIEQIDEVTIEQYRATTSLTFDNHVVSPAYIQQNISGVVLNALYYLHDHHEKIARFMRDDDLCSSDAVREKIVSNHFEDDFAGLSTMYSTRHLICEIAGGCHLAIDLYKNEHGLNEVRDDGQAADAAQKEIVRLVSSLPDIRAHTFLDSPDSDASKRIYLLLLALCVENSAALNGPAREFLALLEEKSGFQQLTKDILTLADHPRKQLDYQGAMLALLDTEDKKFTWLLDALYALTLAGQVIESPNIKWPIGVLKPAQLKECLPSLQSLLGSEDPADLIAAAFKLNNFTHGWKNLVRYRELRFDSCFAEAVKRLETASWAASLLAMQMNTVYSKATEHAYYISFSDGGMRDRLTDKAGAALCSQGRKSALSSLNEFHNRAGTCLSEHQSASYQAQGLISRWNVATADLDVSMPYSAFELDNSVENEDWMQQFEHYYRQVEGTLEGFNRACDDASEQLGFFAAGDFDTSVLAIRDQKRSERERKEQQEKLEKQSVVLTRDQKEHLFTIECQKVEHPPCEAGAINHIETDGKVWVVVARGTGEQMFYRSENGVDWQKIELDTPDMDISFRKIMVVNGVWIITNGQTWKGSRANGYYFSTDALTWQHCSEPKSSQHSLSAEAIVHINGLWLWHFTRYVDYRYIEPGVFYDSTKTASYRESILFCAETPARPWRPWDHTPKLGEGVEIESFCSLPGKNALLAFCKYSSTYIRNKKKPEMPPFVLFYGAAKYWQPCSWGGKPQIRRANGETVLASSNGALTYYGDHILTSDKGYEWTIHAASMHVTACFAVQELHLILSNQNNSAIFVAQDDQSFKELALNDGSWNHLSASEAGVLGCTMPTGMRKRCCALAVTFGRRDCKDFGMRSPDCGCR